MITNKAVRDTLERLMVENRFNPYKISLAMGVNHTTVLRMLDNPEGKKSYSLKSLIKFSEAVEMNLSDLIKEAEQCES